MEQRWILELIKYNPRLIKEQLNQAITPKLSKLEEKSKKIKLKKKTEIWEANEVEAWWNPLWFFVPEKNGDEIRKWISFKNTHDVLWSKWQLYYTFIE